jgi:hypothetical protein
VDVVDSAINALLGTRPLLLLAAHTPHGLSDLLVTLLITLAVSFGLIHGVWMLTGALARGNWQLARGKVTSRHNIRTA